MSESYLLDCECGKRTPVGPSQAGHEIRCACGAALDVPALRALRRLPVADVAAREEQPAWSLRQRLRVIGAVFLLAAAALGGYVRWNRPPPPDDAIKVELRQNFEQFRRDVAHYTVADSRKWFDRRSETELRMFANLVSQHPFHEQYRQSLATNQNWTIVAWSLAGLGVLVIASTHVLAALKPSSKPSGKLRKGRAPSRQS